MTNTEIAETAATVAEQGAAGAPERPAATRTATRKKALPKRQKTPTRAKSRKAQTGKQPKKPAPEARPRRQSKGAKILEMIGRAKGATLAEIMAVTGWQAHYADVRIMPTFVGNPASGAGTAAMKSA